MLQIQIFSGLGGTTHSMHVLRLTMQFRLVNSSHLDTKKFKLADVERECDEERLSSYLTSYEQYCKATVAHMADTT